jgi:peptide/nickel transport system substrate-binding protein
LGLRSLIYGVVGAGLVVSLAACDTSSSGGSGAPGGKTPASMTVDMGYGGTTIARDFNPYSPNAVIGTDGYTYETLFNYDLANNSQFMPWLASSISWADGGRQLTIHLNPKDNWSDGSPLTSADVVFTFQYVASAGLGLITYKSIVAPDPHTVVLTFAQPAYTDLGTIGASYFILPEKIWSHQNLKTWTNPTPVASGPYTLKSYSPQELVWQARSNYWNGDPMVKTLYAPIISQATGVLPLLQSGQVQWSGGAINNVMQAYVAKNPASNHAWYPSYGALFLYPNLRKAPFNNVYVRQGISLAINRAQLSQIVDDGLSYPINLSGMDQRSQASWIAGGLQPDVQPSPEDSAALAAFRKAGYKLTGGKLTGGSGQQLTFSIDEVSTFANSIQRDQLICQQLATVGIKCSVQSVPQATQLLEAEKGTFDMLSGGVVYGVTPYDFYSQVLLGKYIGDGSEKNWEGLNDPAVNSTLTQMTQTGDSATLHQLSGQLEQYVATNLPVIPLSDIGASSEYSTSQWTGWPSANDPYALPAPWAGPPDEINVLLHLRPAG